MKVNIQSVDCFGVFKRPSLNLIWQKGENFTTYFRWKAQNKHQKLAEKKKKAKQSSKDMGSQLGFKE